MRRVPHAEDLENIYYKAVKEHKGLAEDIAHYNRLEEGSGGDRSYEYLFKAVHKFLSRSRQSRNRDNLSTAYSSKGDKYEPLGRGLALAAPKGDVDRGTGKPVAKSARSS
jgi:hypothetical protein